MMSPAKDDPQLGPAVNVEEPWLKLGGPEVPPPPIPPDTPSPPPYDVLEEPPVSGRHIDYRISRDGED